MKQLVQVYQGVVKGTSSGWLVSVLFHLGIFAVALSVYLVLPVVQEHEGYRPVVMPERTRMELIKPQVKIRQTSRPVQQVNRITVERQQVQHPDFAMPAMAIGQEMPLADWGEGMGLLEAEPTLIGTKINAGFGFEGTFYDLKRDRSGRARIMDPQQFVAEVAKFVKSGWRTSVLSRYYRSPNKLYAESFMVPPVRSSVAPAAFEESDTVGYCWLAHYQGQLVYHDNITFRFRGQGDDIMAVRVDGKEVLVASWPSGSWGTQEALTSAAGGWQSSSVKSRNYTLGNNTAVVGDWITLKAGEPLDMEVIIGEVPGGTFCSMLTVEVKGEEYARNRQQGPILPMFKTSEPSRDLKDRILEWMTRDHATLDGGPVFRDIPSREPATQEIRPVESTEPAAKKKTALRLWEVNGRAVEAELKSAIGKTVILKGARGKQLKLPLDALSSEDRKFIELAQPPEFKLDFSKLSEQRIIETTPFLNEVPPRILRYTFGAKIRQISAQHYNHEIKAELYVIGRQRIDDRKFILIDRLSSSFVPASENDRSHVFKGRPVELMSYDTDQPLGRAYSDYLLVLTDERGELIQHSASANWLFPNLGNLRRLQIGNFMDRTCTRVYPTGPGPKSLYDE